MNPHTDTENAILSVLREAGKFAVIEQTLFAHTSAATLKPITRPDFDAALKSLVSAAPQLVREIGDAPRKFTITAEGKDRLHEYKL